MVRPVIGTPGWGDDLNADLDYLEGLAQSGVSLGDVSGTVNLTAGVGLHEMNATGPVILVPNGPAGTVMGVRVLGAGTIDIPTAIWDTPASDQAPCKIVLTHWPSGWIASASGSADPVEVAPAAVTFNNTGNVTTVPSTTGVQYKRAGVNVSAGTISPEPAGSITYTAVAKTGYVIATGATVSWNHTYPALPGWNLWDLMTFTAADGTAVTAVDTQEGRNYTAIGAAYVDTNRVKHAASGTEFTVSLTLAGLPGDRMRHSIDYDLTDCFGGYEPGVFLVSNASVGNLRVTMARLGSTGAATATLTMNPDYADGGTAPTIDYEAGKSSTGHPLAGTMTVEYDQDAELVSIYVDDVLIGTADTSGWTYSGSPQVLAQTAAIVGGTSAYFDFDNHLIEVFV